MTVWGLLRLNSQPDSGFGDVRNEVGQSICIIKGMEYLYKSAIGLRICIK